MKSEMAKKLKELLDGMTQEEFDQKWKEVEELKLEGPTIVEVAEFYYSSQQSTVSNFEMAEDVNASISSFNNQLSLAA
jgi:hypothetical protein